MISLEPNITSSDTAGRKWVPELIDDFGKQAVTGLLKLAQETIMVLLNGEDSYAGTDDAGTILGTAVLSSTTVTQYPTVIGIALSQATTIINAKAEGREDDELIDSLSLVSFESSGDMVMITVELVALSGESTKFVIPVQVPTT